MRALEEEGEKKGGRERERERERERLDWLISEMEMFPGIHRRCRFVMTFSEEYTQHSHYIMLSFLNIALAVVCYVSTYCSLL